MNEALLLVICSVTGTIASLNSSAIPSDGRIKNRAPAVTTANNNNITQRTSHHANESLSSLEAVLSDQKISNRNTIPELRDTVTVPNSVRQENRNERTHFLKKIHRTLTRSKDAVWATITLTFMCVLLVLAVAQSRMWKDYRCPESQGVPLPNFNERVLFRDVMEHKINSLKQIFQKRKKKVSELESLLPPSEWDDESTSIPIP